MVWQLNSLKKQISLLRNKSQFQVKMILKIPKIMTQNLVSKYRLKNPLNVRLITWETLIIKKYKNNSKHKTTEFIKQLQNSELQQV